MKTARSIVTQIGTLVACVFCVSILWEILQTPLYRGTILLYGTYTPASLLEPGYWAILAYAAAGDVLYIALIYAGIALFKRDMLWFAKPSRTGPTLLVIILGLMFAMLIEWHGLESGRWNYSTLMPLVPFLNIGWSPFVQLAITGLFSICITRRILI